MKTVQKVWGYEYHLHNGDFCMKKMQLQSGFKCSVHRHPCKDEAFFVIKGQLILELGDDPDNMTTHILHPHDYMRVPPGTWHRFQNHSGITTFFIEASTYDDPGDCERKEPSGPIEDYV